MVKISFQMIVFNSLSVLPKGMLAACIENVYDLAHEILIAEGAVRPFAGNNGNATWASEDGRSTDGTLEFLRAYPDPKNKIKIFTKEGFWDGKLEMCNAIAAAATGDYIWQLDSDEFYLQEDMERIVSYLDGNRETQRVDFYANHFWGDFDHCCDENTGLAWANVIPWSRIFKHGVGSMWLSHAPPIYSDRSGNIQREIVLTRDETFFSMGIKMFHYGYVSESQAQFKDRYYGKTQYVVLWNRWQKNKEIPLINGDTTVSFYGEHPQAVRRLVNAGTN